MKRGPEATGQKGRAGQRRHVGDAGGCSKPCLGHPLFPRQEQLRRERGRGTAALEGGAPSFKSTSHEDMGAVPLMALATSGKVTKLPLPAQPKLWGRSGEGLHGFAVFACDQKLNFKMWCSKHPRAEEENTDARYYLPGVLMDGRSAPAPLGAQCAAVCKGSCVPSCAGLRPCVSS